MIYCQKNVEIEIPVSNINLTCIIPGIKTNEIHDEDVEPQNNTVSDDKILSAVNKYLEENQGHLGTWFTVSDAPYCPAEYIASNETNWSCPINLSWESYSANEIIGAYPHFAYVDKETLKCTLTANYETVVEFDLSDYLN